MSNMLLNYSYFQGFLGYMAAISRMRAASHQRPSQSFKTSDRILLCRSIHTANAFQVNIATRTSEEV